jgi:hypothetical protein
LQLYGRQLFHFNPSKNFTAVTLDQKTPAWAGVFILRINRSDEAGHQIKDVSYLQNGLDPMQQ